MRSQAGYFFISLRSAIEFIKSMDGESINMNSMEFDEKVEAGERKIGNL